MSTLAKNEKKRTQARTAAGKKSVSGGQSLVFRSGPQLMKWRKETGISRVLFAEMAHFSERTLATGEKASRLPKKIERPVTETVRLIQGLQDLAGNKAALKVWLQESNPAFDNRTPLSLIKNGESDRLWEMVYQIRQGSFA